MWFTGPDGIDIVTAAASMSGISGTGPSIKSHHKMSSGLHRNRSLNTVVTKLHSRHNNSDDDRGRQSDGSDGSDRNGDNHNGFNSSRQFYLSSDSEEDRPNGHTARHGGSYSSKSSARSSSYGSPKHLKRQERRRIEDSDSDTDTQHKQVHTKSKQVDTHTKKLGKRSRMIRDMMCSDSGGYVAPNARKRSRVSENPDKKYPARALEYKNLPFRQQSKGYLMTKVIEHCKNGNVFNCMLMLMYSRSQSIRDAVDSLRAKLGFLPNISVSCPFVTEHTKPMKTPPTVVAQTNEACASGSGTVWAMKEAQFHDCSPRTTDYRTMIIQAATPTELIRASRKCMILADRYPRQVCLRLCNIVGEFSPLPIYDDVVKHYNNCLFNNDKDDSETETQCQTDSD